MAIFTSPDIESNNRPLSFRRCRSPFIACTQVRICASARPCAHTQEWLLIFKTTLITKKRGSEGRRGKIAPLGQKQLREL